MLKTLVLTTAVFLPGLAMAQNAPAANMQMQGGKMDHTMNAGQMGGDAGMAMGGPGDMMAMPGMQDMMRGMMKMMGAMQGGGAAAQGVGGSPLSEPGQSAFAAIAEVVATLEADPNTDWTSVDINALREHLRDMDVVTIWSKTVTEPVEGGLRFVVTGSAEVAPSIERMVLGHASVMDGVDGWGYTGEPVEGGAALTVTVPEPDMAKLSGLGFYGLLASGMHHQPHHWMMATGQGMGMQ